MFIVKIIHKLAGVRKLARVLKLARVHKLARVPRRKNAKLELNFYCISSKD